MSVCVCARLDETRKSSVYNAILLFGANSAKHKELVSKKVTVLRIRCPRKICARKEWPVGWDRINCKNFPCKLIRVFASKTIFNRVEHKN